MNYRVLDVGKTLYLTLDDGPSEATAQILDVLKKHEVRATFFVVTDHIRPDILPRIVAEGHQVAHHMKTTAKMGALSEDQFRSEFQTADKALSDFGHVKLFRPPGGSISRERAKYVLSQDYEIVVGTIFPLDHWLESKSLMIALAKALTTNGGIIILHDTNARGPKSAAVLDELIPQLKEKGYRFALLPETMKD